MVQQGAQSWTGRPAGPRLPVYSPSRQLVDSFEYRRPYDQGPPMAIDTALRTHCGIRAKQYFVAVLVEDGTPLTFFSPGQKLQDHVVRQFFDANKFQETVRSLDSASSQPLIGSANVEAFQGLRPTYSQRPSGSDRQLVAGGDEMESDETSHRLGRKRQRSQYPYDEDTDPSASMLARRGIRVSDSKALWQFYDQRFKNCQQSACKLIAKAWVKAVEPKKQSTHPYTGSDDRAPEWWPKPWGTTKEDKVRHKEPDHLYKRERVHLLNHILNLITEPAEKQHQNIHKLGLSVKKLEECTFEALSGFFSESPTNASKKTFLNEIFKVAKQQERYKNGEIDATVEVYVLSEDQTWDHQHADDDVGVFSRDDDEQQVSPSTRSSSQSFVHTPAVSHSPSTSSHSHTSSFLQELPVRNSQAQSHPPAVLHDMGPQPSSGMLDDGMSVNATATAVNSHGTGMAGVDIHSGANASNRRQTAFGDYGSGNNGSNGLYTSNWQPGTTAPSAHTLYTHQNNQPNPPFVSSVATTHPQSFVPSLFGEAMPRPGFGHSSHNHLFRTGEFPPPPPPLHNYNYGDGRSMLSLPGVSEVIESVPRGHM